MTCDLFLEFMDKIKTEGSDNITGSEFVATLRHYSECEECRKKFDDCGKQIAANRQFPCDDADSQRFRKHIEDMEHEFMTNDPEAVR